MLEMEAFIKVVSFSDRIKADFLRQLRLPAAHTVLQRQKRGSNYSEMKAWQNERCFQLEPWLFHYFNIYKDEPPTAVWAIQCPILYVRVRVCSRQQAKGRETEGKTDKQSESKGVAQSDKPNLMNEPSTKK